MRLKVYGWAGYYNGDGKGDLYRSCQFDVIPGLTITYDFHDFLPDENFPDRRRGGNVCIIFSWLFWGLTLDVRFGRNMGWSKEADNGEKQDADKS